MSEKFDFSKIEEQKEFKDLPQEEKDKIVGETKEEEENEKQSTEGSTIKKIEIPDLGEIEYFEKKIYFSDKFVQETGGVRGYVKKTIDRRIIDLAKKEEKYEPLQFGYTPNKLLISVLTKISDGYFPGKTFNHIFLGDYRGDHKEQYSLLKKEGILKQEINSPSHLKKIRPNEPRYNFDFEGKEIAKVEEKIRSPYFSFFSDGLDVHRKGEIWHGQSPMSDAPLFGFGQKNQVFGKYLELVSELISQFRIDVSGAEENVIETKEEVIKRLTQNFEYMKKYVMKNILCLQGKRDEGARLHPSIPLVVNHPDIPNLRWCHADYAAIPTEKGYNVLEMIT